MPNLGPTELIIILVIVLLLFGGSRLAGLGKSTGRALKEFKEETKGLTKDEQGAVDRQDQAQAYQPRPQGQIGDASQPQSWGSAASAGSVAGDQPGVAPQDYRAQDYRAQNEPQPYSGQPPQESPDLSQRAPDDDRR